MEYNFQASDYGVFGARYNWLILEPENISFTETELQNTSTLFNQLSTLTLAIDCEITIATNLRIEAQQTVLSLYDAYNPGYIRNGLLNITYYGVWSEPENIIINNNVESKYWRRLDMKNITLNTASVV